MPGTAQIVLSGPARQTQASVTKPLIIAGVVAVVAILAWLIIKLKKKP